MLKEVSKTPQQRLPLASDKRIFYINRFLFVTERAANKILEREIRPPTVCGFWALGRHPKKWRLLNTNRSL